MQNKKANLPATLIFITFCLSILFLLSSVALLLIGSIISLIRNDGQAASQMILAISFCVVSLLIGACAWFVLEKVRGDAKADNALQLPSSIWQIVFGVGIIIICIGLGTFVTNIENQVLTWLVLPLLTIFVIVPPIWLVFTNASRGLELGSRWRFFSILGLGMTIAPMLMIVFEIVVLIFVISFGTIYLVITQPEIIQEMASLANLLSGETNQNVIMNTLAPYLINPFTITLLLTYISLIVPLIEELFKPLAVWLFAKQIETPVQGFTLGMLSGAAFALFESLNASANGTTTWGVIVLARAGTSILHITTSGLMGWGIVSAFKEKRYGRLMSAYITAVLIHGIWNASAAGAGISAIGESIGKPEWLFTITPALVCGLMILAIGMVAVLVASNRKLKQGQSTIKT